LSVLKKKKKKFKMSAAGSLTNTTSANNWPSRDREKKAGLAYKPPSPLIYRLLSTVWHL
jgi:ribosome assembly protein YihI (activator of Der GTPase)